MFLVTLEDVFMTTHSLDNIFQSPYSLQPNLKLNDNVVDVFQKYGISRELTVNYVCHWKNWLIQHEIVKIDSLSFQEDEALIHSVLSYPNPVDNWKIWKTLYLYGLKLMTSISSTALNLFRGITNYPTLNHTSHDQGDVAEFVSNLNHPTVSVSSLQRELPDLNYNNESYHVGEILYHIKCLEKYSDSLALTFKNNQVVRFPVTIGVDEQELNPGTFIREGVLHGLVNKMTYEDIKHIGLDNICKHISEENNFIIAVREYRATDFRRYVCSNVSTIFLPGELPGEECLKHLKKSMTFANGCRSCLLNGVTCSYGRFDEPCANCLENCEPCVSLASLHVLWDMATGHKKADKLVYHLTEDSSFEEVMSTNMFTVGFGGLHLGKSLVCTARNYVLSYKGEHFGVNILNELKQTCHILQQVNNSVFVGRDKQSDLLNYMLVGPKVQEALKSGSRYLLSRVPEKYLPYKENAKSHKRIISPVGVCTNRNGDIFVLDSGGCCLHIIDNSSVAKMTTVGLYEKPDMLPYPSKFTNIANNLRLGKSLKDIQIDQKNDDILIHDASRGEIIILNECKLAKKIPRNRFYVMEVSGVLSVIFKDSNLYMLTKSDHEESSLLQQVKIEIPKSKKAGTNNLRLNCKYLKNFTIAISGKIHLFDLPYRHMIGLCHAEENCLFSATLHSNGISDIGPLSVKCEIKPHVSVDEKMVCWSRENSLSLYQLSRKDNLISAVLISNISLDGRVRALFLYGSVATILSSVKSESTQHFSVLEWGPLAFSRMYCEAVHKLYQAINYIPPFGNRDNIHMDQLTDCIEAAEGCYRLLRNMEVEKRNMFEGRESFMGCEGIPWTATVECLRRTIESWRLITWRLETMQSGSSKRVVPHCITNESYVEHSFGFTKKRGQGNNQSQEEYVQSKRTHMVDFQMRMCDLPFCQYTKTKLRDKGYQEVDRRNRQVSMSLSEICEIFRYSDQSTSDNKEITKAITDGQKQLMKKAYLLTKYVPRQSGRNRWRASAGQVPTMIVSQNGSYLHDGDLVFSRDFSGNLLCMIVNKKIALTDKSNTVSVSVLKNSKKKAERILIDQLVQVRQQILTVPAYYFSIEDSVITFSDEFQPLFDEISEDIELSSDITEEEWSHLVYHPSAVENDKSVDNSSTFSKAENCKRKAQDVLVEPDCLESTRKNKRMKKDNKTDHLGPVIERLTDTWKALLPPVKEQDLLSSWIAFIHRTKTNKTQLIFARLHKRFLHDDDGSSLKLSKWQVNCCKPFRIESQSDFVEEVPGGEQDLIAIYNIIFFSPTEEGRVTYSGRNMWLVRDIKDVVDMFKESIKLDREKIMTEFF